MQIREKAAATVEANRLVNLANILVAVDFSATAHHALEHALSLARRYESRVIVAHVVTSSADPWVAPEAAVNTRESILRTAQEEMGEILTSGRLRGVQHETVVEEGALWPTLEALIFKYKADLVVVGTHRVGGIQKVLFGSGAEQIFRQAKCPVLTVGPAVEGEVPAEAKFKNILFATDFGIGAEHEAAYAFSLGQEHGANVTLLHVIRHADDYSEQGLSLKKEAIYHELAELVPPGSEAWCTPEFRMTLGDPVTEILEQAKVMNADLVVIGAKKQKGFSASHALRTTAYRVAGRAPCPVLTVRS